MKLFIDTSNKKLILAIINFENKIDNFFIENTNNNMAKIAISKIKVFLEENNLDLSNIKEYMITIGPGSYTGVKVALNIISTINIVEKINKIYTIDSFKLIDDLNSKYTCIPFGKNKFYFKKNKKSKILTLTSEEVDQYNDVNDGYKNFTKELLQKKIDNKSFKIYDNLYKVKLKYLSSF
ncbi:MAG: tRNA (adenosine(37)-N6)-threonylcarbamoyltransferase complex dimerization subunit type 1 TsaB [Candidatus Tyloplasma litorale]|nr:MAG: tRNA (adenosine(37)-N6)-threonylcarbamoyltransferase complex dimerization subunit type 1 TsaB [Mycoplasmatales bacterium]